MKNNFPFNPFIETTMDAEASILHHNIYDDDDFLNKNYQKSIPANEPNTKPVILFITTFPPRECGIATYSSDLINAIKEKFEPTFSIKICALKVTGTSVIYPSDVKYIFDAYNGNHYAELANEINTNATIKAVFLEHEFGLFGGIDGDYIVALLPLLNKPVITTFHTVLSNPNEHIKKLVQTIIQLSASIIVMTNNSANILKEAYGISQNKIEVIPHGTHLVSTLNIDSIKELQLVGEKPVLSTFGLLSSNKSIETALDALPAIMEKFPTVMYFILGKTHPTVCKNEGEKYRNFLKEKVTTLHLQNNVQFINEYLSLPNLLTYLQRTNIYLFTSKDPNQAVSGTFAYAMGCGCPIVSTPIPHAKEMIDGAGIIIDFENPAQLATATIKLLADPILLQQKKLNALHTISPTAWQNAAIKHVNVLNKNITTDDIVFKFKIPQISLEHIKRLTTNIGMIQFATIATPDITTGYTLDDNARAMVAIIKHYELTKNDDDVALINTYFNFIKHCQLPDGNFLNYVNSHLHFTKQNTETNLADSNGRAIWALGYLVSQSVILPQQLIENATKIIDQFLPHINTLHSTRAMAFVIKGLYYSNINNKLSTTTNYINTLANRLVQMYKHEAVVDWHWYESYLTYGNSILPEALLFAYIETGDEVYKKIATDSFNFLLNIIFYDGQIKVVSNKGWHYKNVPTNKFGEQPIDIAYTILALDLFYKTSNNEDYLIKMRTAFDWFLGNNHLQQIIYNPATGGCYDGLEETHVNLNQGAESTVSYLMARLTVEKYFNSNALKTKTSNVETMQSVI